MWTIPPCPQMFRRLGLHRYISIYETGLWEPWGWSMAIEKTSGCYVCSEIIRAEVILPHHLLKRDDDEVLALIWFVVHPYPLLPPGAAKEPPPPIRRAARSHTAQQWTQSLASRRCRALPCPLPPRAPSRRQQADPTAKEINWQIRHEWEHQTKEAPKHLLPSYDAKG